MAGETVIITIVGNLTADPEIRTTSTGAQVASFTIASTPRVFDRQSNQYVDGQALFMRCSAWRDLAEHCARSLAKGMRVIAQGRLTQRSYEAKDGTNRTVVELQVDEIGPSLRVCDGAGVQGAAGHGGRVRQSTRRAAVDGRAGAGFRIPGRRFRAAGSGGRSVGAAAGFRLVWLVRRSGTRGTELLMLTGRQFEILRWMSDGKDHVPADLREMNVCRRLESRGLLEEGAPRRDWRRAYVITKAGKEAVRRHSGKGKES